MNSSSDLASKPQPAKPGEAYWKQVRKPFLIAISGSFILLQLLFLGNMCYLYGTQFRSSSRYHNFNVLLVDYDGGVIGQSLLAAYHELKGNDFPTLIQNNATDHPDPQNIYESVCRGDYWAAVYTNPGASSRLSSALASSTAATSYNNSDAITYIWNGARYPTIAESAIYANVQTLVVAAHVAYNHLNGSAAGKSIDWSNEAIAQILFNPIAASEIDVKPTNQGTRVLYNTVSMVFPIIQQFFFIMALNGISSSFGLFSKLLPVQNGRLRMYLSAAYTLIGSLCSAGYLWAFREDWDMNGLQFFLTWMALWLYMHISFLVMDVATGYLQMQFMPFFVLTWVVFNIASAVSPFEVNPAFYRWGYALPTHEVYQVLVQIWSGDCEKQLYRSLPILFAWWVVSLALSILSTSHRCKAAVAAERTSALPPSEEHGLNTESTANESKDDSAENKGAPLSLTTTSDGTTLVTRPADLVAIRRQTAESIRLEQRAYGPSYPTPFVHRQSVDEQ